VLHRLFGPPAARALWPYLILLCGGRKHAEMISIGAAGRLHLGDWAWAELMDAPVDFELVLHILGGDDYFERNRRDVITLERETGKAVIDLWDTDPIFAKYPHLRTLARNKEFEEMWAKMKTAKTR
jgi:hypothetical protein